MKGDWKIWGHHVIVPVGLATLFGVISFLRAQGAVSDLPGFLMPPLVTALLIWAVMLPVTEMTNRALPYQKIPLLARLALAAAVGAFPLALLLPLVLRGLGFDLPRMEDPVLSGMAQETAALERYAKVFALVLLLWTLTNYRWYKQRESMGEDRDAVSANPAVAPKPSLQPAPPPLPSEPPPAAFLERMVKPIGRDVWAVKAEQHYIRIYTAQGDELILYRFGDALRDLNEYDGLQVHRSYWVARQAVDAIRQDGAALEIRLRNGEVIPVSRSYKTALKDAGWEH